MIIEKLEKIIKEFKDFDFYYVRGYLDINTSNSEIMKIIKEMLDKGYSFEKIQFRKRNILVSVNIGDFVLISVEKKLEDDEEGEEDEL